MMLNLLQSMKVRRKPKRLGQVLLGIMLVVLLPGCIGPLNKFDDANRAFLLSGAFVDAAARRLFAEAGVEIFKGMVDIDPGDTLLKERSGMLPPCFIRGAPNITLGQHGNCQRNFYWANSDRKTDCSFIKREICNAISIPVDIFENPRFMTIVEGYAENMCKFLRDHQEISAPTAARLGLIAPNFSVVRTMQHTLICSETADRPAVRESSTDFWRRMRPIILIRERNGAVIKEVELRLRFQNL